ncbi:LamG domain-containing protein [Streptomyces sp. FXJ1.172]|uniref:LamG domain-containing protein n=1 Tax=Streptomyces sp. FXJ1.172 TaxID=710705 RepID=UPI000A659EE8|nr:LamG domain-containing protein [Streptomyces sp. FXJ1.172]WEO99416.1 LamG domain-containing protein [Streptomyces sp. FXJ1.172]
MDLDRTDGHVALAEGLLAGASAYSVATWVNLSGQPAAWSRICDFGTGVGANMFLTPLSGSGTLRYAITTSGGGAEQRIDADPLPTDRWVHVAVTYAAGTAVLYVDGREAGRNTAVTVELRQPHPGRVHRQVPVPGPVPEGRGRRLPRLRPVAHRGRGRGPGRRLAKPSYASPNSLVRQERR